MNRLIAIVLVIVVLLIALLLVWWPSHKTRYCEEEISESEEEISENDIPPPLTSVSSYNCEAFMPNEYQSAILARLYDHNIVFKDEWDKIPLNVGGPITPKYLLTQTNVAKTVIDVINQYGSLKTVFSYNPIDPVKGPTDAEIVDSIFLTVFNRNNDQEVASFMSAVKSNMRACKFIT